MQYFAKFIFLVFFFCYASFAASAQIRLPAIIADSMVLQQRSDDPIWGWASPGEEIAVKGSWMKTAPVSTNADSQGKWMVKIKTPGAGGPYTLTIKGRQTIVLHGVMVGEVWICSGQSNMEMPVEGWSGAHVHNSAEEINNARYPAIRLFTVKKDIALQPQEDCTGSWSACTPSTVAGFSATAYFFGRQLYEKLRVPIGLIHTSWGGTVAEAWTSNDGLRKLGDFNTELDKLDALLPHLKETMADYGRKLKVWNEAVKKVNQEYEQENFDDAGWKTMKLPTAWESAGLPGLDGVVWFRKVVELPASWAGKQLKIDLGPIDDMDITWFNGKEVGGIQKDGYWNVNRSYEVPGELVKAGKNVIAVRVTDTGGDGGIDGEKKLLKLYPVNETPGEGISIAGDWQYKVDVVKPQPVLADNPNTPTVLYNGMIAPLIPFAIRGAIWYQGEANVGRAAQYEQLFPEMISDWRSRWKEGNFPFYFVQIAPYKYGGDGALAAALRDAQRKSLATPNTGMIVTLDIGDSSNIHPSNKQEVGRRLSLWALANTYGEKGLVYSGPLYSGMKIQGSRVIVSFEHTDGGLIAKGGSLTGFQVAGAAGDFVPAKAVIRGNKVVVYADKILHPAAVRYGWSDIAEAHLFNKSGLPASSFSTADGK